MILNFKIKGQSIEADKVKIVENTVDYIDASFTFGNEWNGLAKEVYFSKGETTYKIPLINDKIERTAHLNLSAGSWKVACYGLETNGTMVISTDPCLVHVSPTLNRDGVIPPETPPSEIDLILQKSQNAETKANAAMSTVDAKATEINGLITEYNTSKGDLLKAKDDAVLSASNAKASENNAHTSETNAKTSATNAQKSLADVNTVKGLVEDDKVATAELVKLAEQHEKNASASATNAAIETAEKLTAQINTALNKAEAATAGAEKVDIIAWQDASGLTVVTTNRQGEKTECRLSEAVVHINSWKDIQSIVRGGLAKKFIKPGDIFNANYKYNGKVYTMPWHVCDVRNVKTPEGETKEAVIIQSHLVSPIEVPFDTYEAFYVAKEELPAGTYHIVPDEWSKIKAGDVWSFTLTKPLPVGGVLCGFENIASYGTESTYTIKSYATVSDLTEIEAVTARVGTEGTLLGNWVAAGNAELNSIQRVSYGYGRWRDSFQRQWLNNKGTGWWKPQNEYDRPPSNVESLEGFMTGFENEFLDVLRPFVSVTAKNSVTDGGGTEETADIFTLPALEEMYITKQVAGEGEPFAYWKEVSGKPDPFPWYKDTPELVHLDINNTARYVRLRSANVSSACYAWGVYPSGNVHSNYARYTYASAPLAAIY